MGAAEFFEVAIGKTMGEAFDKAYEQAQWEHGHGGYSGTLAEKHSVVDCGVLPARWTGRDFADAVAAARSGDADGWGLADRAYRLRMKRLVERLRRDVPDAVIRRMVDVYHDKWGPAVGIELTGKDLKAAKDRYESTRGRSFQTDSRTGRVIAGTETKLGPSSRGLKAYAFFGLASS